MICVAIMVQIGMLVAVFLIGGAVGIWSETRRNPR